MKQQMNIGKLILVILGLFLYVNLYSQTGGYTITGKINDVPNGTIFYLIKAKESGSADTLQRVKTNDGTFSFKGKLDLQGELHFVKMDTSVVKIPEGRNSWVRLILENSNIRITGNLSTWPEAKIEGSEPTISYTNLFNQLGLINKDFKDKVTAAGEDKDKVNQIVNDYKKTLLQYSKDNAESYNGALIAQGEFFDINQKQAVYNSLSESIKNSFYGVKLKQEIKTMKISSELVMGKLIPDFIVETPSGNRVSIREIAKKSKYTLIDFWAYWCKPCREDIPNMKKVYDAFRDKGFNILSVSTDLNKEKWKKAIAEENTGWVHGIDVDKASKLLFSITAIPAYILINDKGEMIAYEAQFSGFDKGKPKYSYNGSPASFKDPADKGLRGNLHEVIAGLLTK